MRSRRSSAPDERAGAADAGAAVVEFVGVAALATLVLVALVQLALVLHVRNTLVDCASEGARFGALADRTPADGAARARLLVTEDLSPAFARDVTAGRETVDGLDVVVVRIHAPLPIAGLIGRVADVTVTGHGLPEGGAV